MRHTNYVVEAEGSLLKFEFFSEGPNLGFGDVDEKGDINDTVISNNQDSQKVLATVALAVFKFYEKHPAAFVFVTDSTKSRTRLYRMGISNNLIEIGKDFDVYGLIGETWEDFTIGHDYEGFMVKKKEKL